jgi:acyl transferase domain-containing protein/NAD(P)H-dependent flavin oxidoreductase YrpB (nitropropane dioxygenase family)
VPGTDALIDRLAIAWPADLPLPEPLVGCARPQNVRLLIDLFTRAHLSATEVLASLTTATAGGFPLIARIFTESGPDLDRFLTAAAPHLAGVYLRAEASSSVLAERIRAHHSLPVGFIIQDRHAMEWAARHLPPTDAVLPPIVRGNEAGGPGGPFSSLILWQLARRLLPMPFLLEGGLGPAGVRAASAAGADGVVCTGLIGGFSAAGETLNRAVSSRGGAETIRLADSAHQGFRFLPPLGRPFEMPSFREGAPACESWGEWRPSGSLPLGQDIEWAGRVAKAWKNNLSGFLGRLMADLRGPFHRVAADPDRDRFARDLHLAVPIIQGPMARISTNGDFAAAVAAEGGLPVFAFGSQTAAECRAMLQSARARSIRHGAGIIGLDLQADLVQSQAEVLKELPPDLVVVAAPKPELVEALLSQGHDVLSHAFSWPVTQALLEAGCRRFILEGAESGGHIGKLSSLVLWESILDGLKHCPDLDLSALSLVFAGGIVDPSAVNLIGCLITASGLPKNPAWGVQVGTAYLTTREIVETGAMSRNYRNQVLNHDFTLVTGESVKLRARQVATPFVEHILAQEADWQRQGLDVSARRMRFEHENMGNMARAAASPEGEDGCFMAGEAIVLLDRLWSIADLHAHLLNLEDERDRGRRLPSRQIHVFPTPPSPTTFAAPSSNSPLPTRPTSPLDEAPSDGPIVAANGHSPGHVLGQRQTQGEGQGHKQGEPIAIIGLGCVFPGSPDPGRLFANVLARRCFIRPLPESLLPRQIFFSPDRETPYATYSARGAWLDDFRFDPVVFRIPPATAARLDKSQQIALECARQAFATAGFDQAPFDRERVGVIIGNSMGGTASVDNLRAIHFHEWWRRFRWERSDHLSPALGREIEAFLAEQDLPPITGDSLPGELSSLVAGRISAVFDLHGPNFTVDAACGAGLAAIAIAVQGLRTRQLEFALAGGVDTQMDPGSFIKFSKVTALSATGSFPFDARGDGFIMGEGGGLFLLRRLDDALRDGNRIFAVIRGIGQSSDGKGKGITAPNPAGQRRALERAWLDAGLDPSQAGYFEAHGTGTVVGDAGELGMLAGFVSDALAARPSAHSTDPQEAGATAPNVHLPEGNPAVNNGTKVPVGSIKAMIGHTKAAAGAAGLMKTVLAVHQRIIPPQVSFERFPAAIDPATFPLSVPTAPQPFAGKHFVAGVSSFGFGGTNHHVVIEQPPNTHKAVFRLPEPSPEPPAAPPENDPTPGPSIFDLPAIGEAATPAGRAATPRQGPQRPTSPDPATVAFVFPGQGSQYLDMLATWRADPACAAVLAEADRVFAQHAHGASLTARIYPDPSLRPADRATAEATLKDTRTAQPALFAVSAGLLAMLRARGLVCGLALGHSLGEFTALHAAGILSLPEALAAVCIRGRYMAELPGPDFGAMGVIAAGADAILPELATAPGLVVIANRNGPAQTVISGETAAVEAVLDRFATRDILARRLPVSAAFHSPLVAPAVPAFRETLTTFSFGSPTLRVPANVSGLWYPAPGSTIDQAARTQIIDTLCRQAVEPVDFIEQIERAYATGVRIFVEVGPKAVLCKLIDGILGSRPHQCLPLDLPNRNGDDLLRTVEHALKPPADMTGHSPSAPLTPHGGSSSRAALDHPDPSSPSSPPPRPLPKDRAGLLEEVQRTISEISGYPVDLIKPDMALEADLGIDTLKIFEIGSSLRGRLGTAKPGRINLSRLRTPHDMVALLEEMTNAAASPTSGPPPGPDGSTGRTRPGVSPILRHELIFATGSPPDPVPEIPRPDQRQNPRGHTVQRGRPSLRQCPGRRLAHARVGTPSLDPKPQRLGCPRIRNLPSRFAKPRTLRASGPCVRVLAGGSPTVLSGTDVAALSGRAPGRAPAGHPSRPDRSGGKRRDGFAAVRSRVPVGGAAGFAGQPAQGFSGNASARP